MYTLDNIKYLEREKYMTENRLGCFQILMHTQHDNKKDVNFYEV